MRKLALVVMILSSILLWSSAFADTTSNSERSISRSDKEKSDAYYYAHAAGMMSFVIKGASKLTFADVVSQIKSE